AVWPGSSPGRLLNTPGRVYNACAAWGRAPTQTEPVARPIAGRRALGFRLRLDVRTVRDVSAGGVITRVEDDTIELVLVGRARPERWSIPKGTPLEDELDGIVLH